MEWGGLRGKGGGGIRQIWGNFLSRLSAESDRLLYPNLEQRSHLFITSSTQDTKIIQNKSWYKVLWQTLLKFGCVSPRSCST